MMTRLAFVCGMACAAGLAAGQTSNPSPSVYAVPGGVDFELRNVGAADYLFTWSDSGGTFSNIVDPTLILTAGQTYTFERYSTAHPFVITDTTMPVSGATGSEVRTTTSGAVIDAATLEPIADFTANASSSSGPSGDPIVWTPGEEDIGVYRYTCRVTGHTGMTGTIEVVSGLPALCSPADLDGNDSIDVFDLIAFLQNFDPAAMCPADAACGVADLDSNDTIDVFDLIFFLQNFDPADPNCQG